MSQTGLTLNETIAARAIDGAPLLAGVAASLVKRREDRGAGPCGRRLRPLRGDET